MSSILTIAGTDPSGGAGIPIDLQVFRDFGHHGLSVVSAVVAQNTSGVHGFEPVSGGLVRVQMRGIRDDIQVAGIKIGMLPTIDIVRAVASELESLEDIPVVCDPVLVSGSGETELRRTGTVLALRESLLSALDWLTPNVPEAEALLETSINDRDDAARAAAELQTRGPEAVLLKMGHLPGREEPETFSDLLAVDGEVFDLEPLEAIETDVRGTGCQLSSAIVSIRVQSSELSARGVAERARRYLNDHLHDSRESIGRGRPVIVRD